VTEVRAPLQGTVVHIPVDVGGSVAAGADLVVIESMRSEEHTSELQSPQ